MTIRKFNYFRFFIFIIICLAIIIGIVVLISQNKYKSSLEYSFLKNGYQIDEYNNIVSKLNKDEINKLLTIKYDNNISSFVGEKYFIFDNLESYLEYKKKNSKMENNRIVSIINSEANIDWFENEKETDTSKNELMIVNRIYGLNKDYVPEDLVTISSQYAYDNKKISKSILENIISLINAGKENGYTFVVSDGYRSYGEQEKLYNNYANAYGMSEADKFVARAGHSEYQTGLTFDLKPYNKVIEDVKNNEEYLWLKENAHKYGFIFRLDSEHEYLTGFPASSWKLRYVGESVASLMYSENICFEEYYAYFIGGNKNE